ncbi:hypothetical protein [Nitrospirillum bahiense]|nr:hypothetical protein [Nitrospirillum amazonense]
MSNLDARIVSARDLVQAAINSAVAEHDLSIDELKIVLATTCGATLVAATHGVNGARGEDTSGSDILLAGANFAKLVCHAMVTAADIRQPGLGAAVKTAANAVRGGRVV